MIDITDADREFASDICSELGVDGQAYRRATSLRKRCCSASPPRPAEREKSAFASLTIKRSDVDPLARASRR